MVMGQRYMERCGDSGLPLLLMKSLLVVLACRRISDIILKNQCNVPLFPSLRIELDPVRPGHRFLLAHSGSPAGYHLSLGPPWFLRNPPYLLGHCCACREYARGGHALQHSEQTGENDEDFDH